MNDHVEISSIPSQHKRSLMGSLAPYVRTWPEPEETWEEIRERAWRAAIGEAEDEKRKDGMSD